MKKKISTTERAETTEAENGIMEYWNHGMAGKTWPFSGPLFQYSIIPIFH
jgi:hypothetical protein